MKRTLRGWRLVFRGGAIAVAALAGGMITYASIPTSDGVIHACYSNPGGRLRVIDTDTGGACVKGETALNWNQLGPPILMNRNFQDVALAGFPGVTTASLSLPPGSYMMWAKFRYRGNGGTTETASCVFQGDGIGGLDSSQHNVPPGGEADGQVDGIMMDTVIKQSGNNPDIHVQCFGPPDVSIINTQFVAIPTNLLILQP